MAEKEETAFVSTPTTTILARLLPDATLLSPFAYFYRGFVNL